MYKKFFLIITVLLLVGCSTTLKKKAKKPKEAIKQEKIILGQMLFFDTILSKNKTQSCATCHSINRAFSDDRDNAFKKAVSQGDDGISFGGRNAPTAGYAMFSPKFHFDKKEGNFIGGQFWDGRASTLIEQAKGPILNPLEMGMPDKKSVINRLENHKVYSPIFRRIYGSKIFNNTDKAYDAIADSIAQFERSKTFAPFDSKYDRYLKGEYDLTPLEDLGRSIFFSPTNTNCIQCHQLRAEDAPFETFTNYRYFNIGVPQNKNLPNKSPDKGLLDNPSVEDEQYIGKFKTPTLRNVAVTAPYMHNGVFQTLRGVIEFYDHYNNPIRVRNPETNEPWGEAEIPQTIDREELKAKKLSDRKVEALVAFLKLLTDKRYEGLLEKN